ncbi:DUF732 domain-containing protein [Nocardia sp. NPDC052566]|uniref:DUF732 domain-containing protein n=1 Tax=Nocardia sp. NPDC052566 TaxID=3364330 RepID=UPI0037CBA735
MFTVALSVSLPGIAQADQDTQAFLRDIVDGHPIFEFGVNKSPETMLAEGYLVCANLQKGTPAETVARDFQRNANTKARGAVHFTLEDMRHFVNTAAQDLCGQ